MSPLFCVFILSFLLTSQVLADTGFDSTASSGAITVSQFQTTLANGYTFFVGQYFDGSKVTNPNTISGLTVGVNNNGISSIKNCRTAGYNSLVDAYHTPAYTVSAPLYYPFVGTKTNIYAQARKPIDYLNSAGALIGRTWLVVLQDAGSKWSTDPAKNRAFITEFLSYFPTPLGPQVGILTDQANFQAIVGSSYVPVDKNNNPVQLWWKNCNDVPQYTGFLPFNGWTTPSAPGHQYGCSKTNIGGASGVNGNLDWFG